MGPAARACGLRRRRPPRPSPTASTASRRSRSRTWPTRRRASPAPTCAGWRSSGRIAFIREQLRALPRGRRSAAQLGALAPTAWSCRLTEGWRGEICHVAVTDADGPLRALQDRRSLLPQLVRPGLGPARRADLRFPAVQQELQPLLLRARPVERDGTIDDPRRLLRPLAPGPPHHALSRRAAAGPARALRGPPDRSTRAPAQPAAAACAEACPDGRHSRVRPTAACRIDLGRCLFCRDCERGLPAGRHRLHRRPPPGRRRPGGPDRPRRPARSRASPAAGQAAAPPLRPLPQAPRR